MNKKSHWIKLTRNHLPIEGNGHQSEHARRNSYLNHFQIPKLTSNPNNLNYLFHFSIPILTYVGNKVWHRAVEAAKWPVTVPRNKAKGSKQLIKELQFWVGWKWCGLYLLSMKVKLKMQLKSDIVKSAKLKFTFMMFKFHPGKKIHNRV